MKVEILTQNEGGDRRRTRAPGAGPAMAGARRQCGRERTALE